MTSERITKIIDWLNTIDYTHKYDHSDNIAACIRDALREIPDLERAVGHLYTEGYSAGEIAELLSLEPEDVPHKINTFKCVIDNNLKKRSQHPEPPTLLADPAAGRASSPAMSPPGRDESVVNILVVDDYFFDRERLRVELARPGRHVDVTDNGDKALALLLEKNYSLLITDIYHDGLSGIELIGEIKSRNLPVAVVVTSSNSSLSVVSDALESGTDEYIIKPFNPNRLAAVIDRVLQQKGVADCNRPTPSRLHVEPSASLRPPQRDHPQQKPLGIPEHLPAPDDAATYSAQLFIDATRADTGPQKSMALDELRGSGTSGLILHKVYQSIRPRLRAEVANNLRTLLKNNIDITIPNYENVRQFNDDLLRLNPVTEPPPAQPPRISQVRANHIKSLLETLPQDAPYKIRVQAYSDIRSEFIRDFASSYLETLKGEIAARPHASYDDKKNLVGWINGELRKLGLAVKSTKTDRVGNLVADRGNHADEGRFQIRSEGTDGKVATFSTPHLSTFLESLQVMDAPPREEGLSNWANRTSKPATSPHR